MDEPAQFVVMQEYAEGNESVGSMWIGAAVFPPTATLAEVWKWASAGKVSPRGRTMIRPDEK